MKTKNLISFLLFAFLTVQINTQNDLAINYFTKDFSLSELHRKAMPPSEGSLRKKIKKMTLLIYMSADNDLKRFAARNIEQLTKIGSNKDLNIVIHLDIRLKNNRKITRRYYIEKNKIIHVNANDPESQRMDSGNPKTLESCFKWISRDYPAEEYGIFFWNHGTGIIDLINGRSINPMHLFTMNRSTDLFEVDRSIEFFDWAESSRQRGICWDDSSGNYLTNRQLDNTLSNIRKKYMQNKKFALIAFDACLMQCIEIMEYMEKHTKIIIGSQEVELGTGYNYALALDPLKSGCTTNEALAAHIVLAYQDTYQYITKDYTQSAVDLRKINPLLQNINNMASMLIRLLNQKSHTAFPLIKQSRNRHNCTHFDEPRYIDLDHFYSNLINNISRLKNQGPLTSLLAQIKRSAEDGRSLIKKAVIANVAGSQLKNAKGITIYFPEDGIHPSYPKSSFAKNNGWISFLDTYQKRM